MTTKKKLTATKVKATANVPTAARPPAPTVKPPPVGTFRPSAPAPPRPPETAALPPDATYQQQMADLQKTHDVNVAAIGQQRQSGLNAYGFTAGADNVPIYDPSNPFSKSVQLKQNYDRSRRSAGQSMGAGGQLYSGAYQNQQDFINRNQLGAEDSLQRSVIDFLARSSGRVSDQDTALSQGALGALGDSVTRQTALANADNNPNYSATYDNAATPGSAPNPAEANNPMAQGKVVTKKSTANGGKMWRYRVRPSDGQLIPIGPA